MKLEFPISDRSILKRLKIGDTVLVSGTLYTARDAAHKKLVNLISNGKKLPIEIKNQAIYYTGPCPQMHGMPIGACGPTTSSRMDKYAPVLLDLGQAAIIGKGNMSDEVREKCRENGAVYLVAAGGAGALLASCVVSSEVVAFDELLSEAIHKLTVKDFPLTVAFDTEGNDIFTFGRNKYKE